MKDGREDGVEDGMPMPRSGGHLSVSSAGALAALGGAGAPRHAVKEVTSCPRTLILSSCGLNLSDEVAGL